MNKTGVFLPTSIEMSRKPGDHNDNLMKIQDLIFTWQVLFPTAKEKKWNGQESSQYEKYDMINGLQMLTSSWKMSTFQSVILETNMDFYFKRCITCSELNVGDECHQINSKWWSRVNVFLLHCRLFLQDVSLTCIICV
jgi:hypothetical protein